MTQQEIKVLLIEDNPGDARLIQEMLRGTNGYSFDFAHANRLAEGLRILSNKKIDIVVLDLTLPDSSGYETFHRVHLHSPKVPVVLLTGLEDETLGIRAVREGAQDYLIKGDINENLLPRSIQYALERKRASDALQESQQLFENMFASLRDAVFIIDTQSKIIIDCNPAATTIFGYTREEMIGEKPCILFSGWRRDLKSRDGMCYTVGEETDPSLQETLMQHKDGSLFYTEYRVVPLMKGSDQGGGWVMLIRDITARKKAQEILKETQERYMLAIQGANDGLWDWNLRTNLVYFSPRWKAMLGFKEKEIGDDPQEWFKRIHSQDLERVKIVLANHLKGAIPHFECEYRMLHRDGTYRWELTRGLAVRDDKGVAYRMAGSQTDITARKNAEEQLLYDAFHDNLTGLPNRALFLDRLGRTIELTNRRKDYLFAVLFLDLDRFKIINDSLGHSIGDQLLIRTAKLLQRCLRSGDTVARLGGDEFVILLEDIQGIEDATLISNRIQKELMNPFIIENHKVYTSASIGIVLSTTGYENKEGVLRDADIAMYQAKLLGKSRHVVFDTEMRKQAIARLELENDLRRAFERDELRLHYQPIISLENESIIGFEALLRWQHPEKGFIPPSVFIPVAEETGLILPIGHWVLNEACKQLRIWQERFAFQPPLTINVNISGKQFAQPEFVGQIKEILESTRLDASSLNLEITENMLMEDAESVISLLNRLRELGVILQIDDFGTGYSSFSYLQRFPINTLKIDYSFINRIGSQDDRSEIVKTILVLARELSMDAIAEGVETEIQFSQLKALGCEYGQGYFISVPVDSEIANALLERQYANLAAPAPEPVGNHQTIPR